MQSDTLVSPDSKTSIPEEREVRLSIDETPTTGPELCRICHRGRTSNEQLITPCRCEGVLRYSHQSCLQEQMTHSGVSSCEICHSPLKMQPGGSLFKKWNELNLTDCQRRTIIFAAIGMFILSTFRFWQSYANMKGNWDPQFLEWVFWLGLIVCVIGWTQVVLVVVSQWRLLCGCCVPDEQ